MQDEQEVQHDMHRFTRISLAVLALVVAVPAVASAQQSTLKIAYVDSEQVIRQAPGYTEASEAFNRTASGWRDTLEQRRTRLQELFDEYKRQDPVLSPEMRTEKQQEILALEQEVQTYFQSKFGPEGEASTTQAELMRPIVERVNQAIDEVRRSDSYHLIFDLNDGALVAGDPSLNITDLVIQRMNAQAGAPPSR